MIATESYIHVDPEAEPDRATRSTSWPPFWRETLSSPEMQFLVEALRLPGSSVRDSLLDDLCTYNHCTREEAISRATNWGREISVEWEAAGGDVEAYHRTTASSLYSLLWYAYLQAEGMYYPLAPGIARAVGKHGVAHLDLGSGVGTTSQVFQSLGYDVTLADISTSLLEFCRFRLDRRGIRASYIDLNTEELPTQGFDVITAIDVLAHVPDLAGTVGALHRALKPRGILFANLVTRAAAGSAPWHLYEDDREPRKLIHRAGFEPVRAVDKNAGIIYRKVDPKSPARITRTVRDAILLGPMRGWYRAARSFVR